MMKRRIITALMCVIIGAGLLTGCGKKNGDYPVEKGATQVVFWAQDFEEWNNDHLYAMVKEFNSILDDGIQVKLEFYADKTLDDKLTASRGKANVVDIYMMSYGNLANEYMSGYGTPLDDLMPAEAFADIKDNVKEMVSFNGKYYGYPQLIEPSTLLYYNKEMLAKAGVTSDPNTWDWNTFLAECAKIKPTLKNRQYVLGLPKGGIELGWASLGMQYDAVGQLPISEDWRTCYLASQYPEIREKYYDLGKYYFDLYANGYATSTSVSLSGLYVDIIEGMVTDKLAMTFSGSWSIAEILNTYPDYVDKIGIAPIPTKTGSKEGITASNGGWTYLIHKDSPNKQKAADFMYWLLAQNPERTASFFEVAQYSKVPATKSVQTLIEAKDKKKEEWLDVVFDVSDKAKPEPLYVFDISIAVADILTNIALDADISMSAGEIRTFINGQIDTAYSKVMNHITNNKYDVGDIKNPQYKAPK